MAGCPVNVNIPRFIDLLAAKARCRGRAKPAGDNALPAITGRVCPQETQCEAECVRGAKGCRWPSATSNATSPTGRANHRDQLPQPRRPPPASAWPSSAPVRRAHRRRRTGQAGHDVTVYEALHKPGGVLVYGIPEFRLPKKIVAQEVQRLQSAGVKIECNVVIGRTYTLPELRERFDAVFIANGAGLPVFMNVPGENFKGVYSANEYLTRVNLMAAYQFPNGPTRPCSTASAWPSSAAATWPWTPCAPPNASAPSPP
jgi:glutamate synthase (NADPH/NADH) small chain